MYAKKPSAGGRNREFMGLTDHRGSLSSVSTRPFTGVDSRETRPPEFLFLLPSRRFRPTETPFLSSSCAPPAPQSARAFLLTGEHRGATSLSPERMFSLRQNHGNSPRACVRSGIRGTFLGGGEATACTGNTGPLPFLRIVNTCESVRTTRQFAPRLVNRGHGTILVLQAGLNNVLISSRCLMCGLAR